VAVAGYAVLCYHFPQWYWQQTDATVYRGAGLLVRHRPDQLYTINVGSPTALPYLYTPFAALIFAAGSLLSFSLWQVILAVVTIGLTPVIAYAALGMAGRPAGQARAGMALAVGGVCVWLEPVAMTLYFGQINMVLLALVVVDLALPDRFRGKGIMIGIAAGIKLTPLIFIVYLLLTRRIRAAIVSIATFAVTILIGLAALPHDSFVYWGGKFLASEVDPYPLTNQTLNGVLLRLDSGLSGAHKYWLISAAIVGIAGLAISVLASRRGHELLAVVTCIITMLLVSPISYTHDYVVVVAVLALAAFGPARMAYRVAGCAVLIALFGFWPLPIPSNGGWHPDTGLMPRGLLRIAPHNNGLEFHWRGLELLVGNYYVAMAVGFVAVTGCVLLALRRRERPASGSDAVPGSTSAANPQIVTS
jgi:alpha-1,2-mannosyltransferase